MAKIPDNAKRVFKGVIFDVYQWEQELYDGSKATFEAIKRAGTIQVIPIVGDKIQLSYEEQPTKKPTLTFLGGRQEEGEDPLVGAKRELLEEAGLESDDWELYDTYGSRGKIDWNTFLFIARNCRKVSGQNLDAGERIEVRSFSFDEFIEQAIAEDFWGPQPVTIEFLRMKQDPQKLLEFKRKLFN